MLSFARWTVLVFALVLVATGLAPLVNPAAGGATSSAPAYAWFHLVSAAVGLASFALGRGAGAPWFAVAFGATDLYQWVASWAGWFPKELFRWTPTDDLLHIGLGLALVALGVAALVVRRSFR